VISVVFDTVIFVRGLINADSLCGRLVFDYANRYRLVISQPVLIEILEVMTRSDLTRKYRGLATRNMQVLLGILASADEAPLTHIPAVSRDPKDDKFLATAVAGQATYLVSEDKDLLDIGEYEGIKIITAAAFLAVFVAEA
jgi:uncharacterized protein